MNAECSSKSYIVPEGFNVGQWFLNNQLPLSTGAKLTYVILATCSYRRDYAWPSLDFLAEKVSASKRTVRRYVDELTAAGFIEVTHEFLMGKTRLIFRFLNHAVLCFEKTGDSGKKTPPLRFEELKKEAASGVKKSRQNYPENVENGPSKKDKNDTCLYKEESYRGKEEINITPLPPLEALDQAIASGSPGEVTGKVGDENFSGPESAQDDPAWAKVKKLLAEKLSQFDLDGYIEPLLFERFETRAVVRVPNSFFLGQLRQKFSYQLREAFKAVGYEDFCFEEMTPEQRKNLDIQTREKERRAEAMKEAAQQIAEEQVDFGCLPLEELYDRLYHLYPRHERKLKGFIVFDHLARADLLPPMPRLMSAIRRQKNNNPKWQKEEGRYIPQLHRWLTERRWED